MQTRRSWRNQERLWRYLGGTDKVAFIPPVTTKREYRELPEKDKRPLFIGVMAGGISYCDTRQETYGDYVKVAFLPYSTLVLDIHGPKSDLLPSIMDHAGKIIARRGEDYVVSGCGQTVRLGGA